ncbi:sodium/myo-inositol cotransporter 2 isoform X1 [Oryctolagus cuniculus]|uniref:Sodium/myo-inositol cotransporter 2 n=2 Tax=Oryctolagus cuniculus TaxID=9986 RepID=SC5AB_RABIT|nr:sodium/myo-inositol cotransporter 2 isoform X1 [Oryctolagus cuniculus]XP_051703340.1 sodium/myo-inositol cotransporter 2 isoform X1 [Oryctolagus cuniculus]XP_051703341.1 sodium/myo-inositol cotransporter 2 isoform X1 [Oryctolagus cuniculus]XP_051703342.1 sodium/myo-inositol cotransporter 2 isoform X1 [Oryctolagus cuniculus]Q28728.2 RecName: Full=Sodium/myo-inositol cotransporter 2; Short=Na(+)/myo-inositol cotransporter 2; AltName: Full=Sodium-dependent glucose cotransporter; AltName: Full=S
MESSTSSPQPPLSDPLDPFPQRSLEPGDIAVLVLYFLFVLAVGLWSTVKTKRDTVKGYFLAGGDMVWWPVGASLFASNVGSGHFVGLAGSGAATGISVAAYEFNGMFSVLMLAWIFLPIYIAGQVTTMPEYLRRRFGGSRIAITLAVLYLFIYIFTKISVDMYAGAIFIQQSLHLDLYLSVVGLLAVTALYTVAGGLAAVIYTDALQTLIMLVGALTLMGYSFAAVGGMEGLQEKYFLALPSNRSENSSCGLPREDAFHLFRDPLTSDLPWPGILFGMSIPSLWYWCTDQVIVQRSLAAKNLSHAKGGSLMAAYLKVLPLFIMVFPGMVSRILFPDQVACADPETCQRVCNNPSGCSDIAYPKLVLELLPTGLRGLMMAVMVAALMSSLTSIFNSASTIFTMDLWNHVRPRASEKELMIVGRVFVLLLVLVSVLWIPVVQASQGGQLFVYIQAISSYLQPPVAMVFVLGCFWKRANEKGAFWGLVLGLLLGFIRLILDFIYVEPACHQPDERPSVVKNVHYLYFSMILSSVTVLTVTVMSLLTEPPSKEMISHLTWFTRRDPVVQKAQVPAATPLPPALSHNGTAEANSASIQLETIQEGASKAHSSDVTPKQSRVVRALLWLCGMEGKSTEQAPRPAEPVLASIEENPVVKTLLDVNCLLCICCAFFLWGYFA